MHCFAVFKTTVRKKSQRANKMYSGEMAHIHNIIQKMVISDNAYDSPPNYANEYDNGNFGGRCYS